MKYIKEDLIDSLLPHDELHAVLRTAFVVSLTPATVTPPRLALNAPLGVTLIKPCMIPMDDTLVMGTKIVSVRSDNSKYNESNVPSTIVMIDCITGAVSHILPGDLITARRTAGASGVATAVMHDSDGGYLYLTVFGAGIQGEEHVHTMVLIRPKINHVTIVNRSQPRLTALLEKLRQRYPNVEFCGILNSQQDEISAAISKSDIVCCCASRTPGSESGKTPLFDGSLLKAGAHVNSVGSFTPDTREIDKNILTRSKGRITIDDDGARSVGDFVLEGVEGAELSILGKYMNEQKCNATTDGEIGDITFFKSVGVGWLDVIAGRVVINNANKMEDSFDI